ncbi:hypothetical protein PSHT_11783 [Puccinia striiformis]|uniref:Uncharacterized protein n=2 Tax=Puccinia striiformis TaxID=27350 RepID=A0A2S4V146_9BASI|nr:hypothetical protein PSHT_11783 [Puccinia striiformis]
MHVEMTEDDGYWDRRDRETRLINFQEENNAPSDLKSARLKSIKQETVGKSDPINHMITPYHLNAPTLNNLHSILAEGAEVNLERPRSPSIAPTPSSYIKSPVIQRPLDLAIVTGEETPTTEEPTRKGPTLSKPLGQERSGLLSLLYSFFPSFMCIIPDQ